MLVQDSMGLVLHSGLVYQRFDTHDKFSQTLPHFLSILANRSAVGYYPQSCLHPSDHSWVNYVPIQVSLVMICFDMVLVRYFRLLLKVEHRRSLSLGENTKWKTHTSITWWQLGVFLWQRIPYTHGFYACKVLFDGFDAQIPFGILCVENFPWRRRHFLRFVSHESRAQL